MAKLKKAKKIHICNTCKGNGYVKSCNRPDVDFRDTSEHQCWDCDSEGEL